MFLLYLVKRNRANENELVDMKIGRQESGDYLGLTLETISRSFSQLKRLRLISFPGRRCIIVHSLAGLKDLAK